MTEIKLRIMKGIGNKAGWFFLQDENYNVIRGFRTGGMAAIRTHLERKYQTVTFGGYEDLGDARNRIVYVTPLPQVKTRADRQPTEMERVIAAGSQGRTAIAASDPQSNAAKIRGGR